MQGTPKKESPLLTPPLPRQARNKIKYSEKSSLILFTHTLLDLREEKKIRGISVIAFYIRGVHL